MTYHVGYASNGSYIIVLQEDGSFRWLTELVIPSDFDSVPNGTATVDEWLANCASYGIQYLGSFTDDTFDEWCAQHPEYFI